MTMNMHGIFTLLILALHGSPFAILIVLFSVFCVGAWTTYLFVSFLRLVEAFVAKGTAKEITRKPQERY